jgi:trigger factor
MQAEEEKSITVSFPADYHNKEVAGKQAEFKIKLHKVAQAHLPELNDKFAEKLGIKEGGIQKLHAQLREKMQENLQASLEMKNKTAVLDKMLEVNKIEIPNALIENETEALREQFMNQFSQQLSKDQQPAIDKAIFKEQAIKRVSLGLLMAEVVKKYDIKPDEVQVRKIVEDLAASHDDPEKVINWYMSDKKHLQHFEQINTEDQVVAKLLEGAKIKEKKLNFDEVVKHE